MGPISNTPVEAYDVNGYRILVKREDLSTPLPGPPFSKCRGLYAKMLKLRQQDITVVGYAETAISMAGWAVAWCAASLKMEAVIFEPQYKHTTPQLLVLHRQQWEKFGAEVVKMPAGRVSIIHYKGRRWLHENYGRKALMLPIGLPFDESVDETAKEWRRTMEMIVTPKTTVLCIGSGTIAAGILKGMRRGEGKLIGILVHPRNIEKKKQVIQNKAGLLCEGLFAAENPLTIIDAGWQYTQRAVREAPFPCHSYYDLKAWDWLVKNTKYLATPVLFWNIGREVGQ